MGPGAFQGGRIPDHPLRHVRIAYRPCKPGARQEVRLRGGVHGRIGTPNHRLGRRVERIGTQKAVSALFQF